jgi:mono/diheme cytochrome c family protein
MRPPPVSRRHAFAAVPLIVIAGLAYFALGVSLGAQPDGQGAGRPAALRGQALYEEHCAECHGNEGRGDGPAAYLLVPRPRDLASGRYKIRSTESGSLPTDDDLLRTVRRGLDGSSMPGWDQVLSDADIRAVVEYIKALSPRFAAETPRPLASGRHPAADADSLSRGAAAYEKLQCGKCHGRDGRGDGAVATEFEDDWRQPLRSADLTAPWTFRGGATPQDLSMRFRAGMSGTPMPSFADAASETEIGDLANYVASLARRPVWEMSASEVTEFYAQQQAAARANPVRRGKYLVDTTGCALCHSPTDEDRRLIPGMYLAGGLRMRLEPFGEYPTGNLTSDPATGLGNWTDDEIVQAFTRGILRDGTRLLPYPMDWPSFANMSPDDVSAIVAYLRTVPPVVNKIPPPSRPFLPVYLWGKFNMLFLGGDPPIVIYPGNAGSAGVPESR